MKSTECPSHRNPLKRSLAPACRCRENADWFLRPRLAMRQMRQHFLASIRADTQVGGTSNGADARRSAPMRGSKSPAWDLVWILNALWLAPLVLLLARGHDDMRASPVDGLFFALAVPLWFGHRVSSAWLAYATPAYRPLLTKQWLRFVLAPIAVVALWPASACCWLPRACCRCRSPSAWSGSPS